MNDDNSAISMLIYLSQSLPSIQNLVLVAFALIGLVITGGAIISFYQDGRSLATQGMNKQLSLLIRILVGSMLFSLWWLLDTTAGSIFTETDTLIVEEGVPLNADIQQAALMTIVNLLAIIGYISGGKGLLSWANGPTNQQPGWVGRGLTLIIAGAILTNMWIAVDYTARTFGMSALGTEYFRF